MEKEKVKKKPRNGTLKYEMINADSKENSPTIYELKLKGSSERHYVCSLCIAKQLHKG